MLFFKVGCQKKLFQSLGVGIRLDTNTTVQVQLKDGYSIGLTTLVATVMPPYRLCAWFPRHVRSNSMFTFTSTSTLSYDPYHVGPFKHRTIPEYIVCHHRRIPA